MSKKKTKALEQVTEGYECSGPITEEFSTFSGNPFINAETIYWHLEGNITEDFEEVKVVEAFRMAFSILQPYFSPIQFKSTSDIKKANLIIHFAVNGDNDLPRQFPKHVLAYAFSPSNNVSNLWFDDSKEWADMHMPTVTEDGERTYNLTAVTVHEVLHSLGFRHSDAQAWPGDILNPTYQAGGRIEFSQDTVNAINFLYGDLKEEIKKKKEEEKVDEPNQPSEGGEEEPPVTGEDKGCVIFLALMAISSAVLSFF